MSIHIQEKDYDIGALYDLRSDMQVTSRMDANNILKQLLGQTMSGPRIYVEKDGTLRRNDSYFQVSEGPEEGS